MSERHAAGKVSVSERAILPSVFIMYDKTGNPRCQARQGERRAMGRMHHAAKLQEWETRIRECRSSGKAVTEWCRENGISAKTYYRWERNFLAEATKALTLPAGNAKLVRIELGNLPTEERGLPALSGIRLQHGATSIELPAGTAPEAVAALVAALNRHA